MIIYLYNCNTYLGTNFVEVESNKICGNHKTGNNKIVPLNSLPAGLFYFMTYSEKLQDPRWQKLRLQVFDRDKFTCQLCGDKETTLNVHHDKYFKNPWDTDIDDLRTLCCVCHSIVEEGKKDGFKAIHIEKVISESAKICMVYANNGNNFLVIIYCIGEKNQLEYIISISDATVYRLNSILKSF